MEMMKLAKGKNVEIYEIFKIELVFESYRHIKFIYIFFILLLGELSFLILSNSIVIYYRTQNINFAPIGRHVGTLICFLKSVVEVQYSQGVQIQVNQGDPANLGACQYFLSSESPLVVKNKDYLVNFVVTLFYITFLQCSTNF